MVGDSVYPVLRCVLCVHSHLRWDRDVSQVWACISELRFLGASLCWFAGYEEDDRGDENLENLKNMLHTIESTCKNLQVVFAETLDDLQEGQHFGWKTGRGIRKIVEKEEITVDFERYKAEEQPWEGPSMKVKEAKQLWNLWTWHIGRTIDEYKLHIRRYSPHLLHCTFNYRSALSADQILKFLDIILKYLKALVRCITGEAVPLKLQIENFEERLKFLHAFFKLIPDDCTLELRDFRRGLYNDIYKLAWLTFFFSAKAEDGEISADLNLVLSDMLKKIVEPTVPDAASWYFGVLKEMQLQRSEDALLLGQAVPGFLDLLFEYLGVPFHEDIQILRDCLITFYTFLLNPPNEFPEYEKLLSIHDQIGDLLRQGSHLIPSTDGTKKDFAKEEVHLSSFVKIFERLKGNIRRVHNRIPDSSSSNFPRTSGIGFIDFLLQNLRQNLKGGNMFIPFAEHLIIKIEQKLVSLRPDLDDIFERQKEQKELQGTWLQLINLAYHMEHTVNSCSITLHPIWYNMVRLADILDEIKVIEGKLDTFKRSKSYNDGILPKSLEYKNERATQAWHPGVDEVMVGFQDELGTIVEQLTRGYKSLEIVSIVGMGGSGKTTLARKAFNTKQVRSHFRIFAFCTVSQVFSPRNLLLKILKNINGVFADDESMTIDDLAHMLHKQLSRKRYLVLMDDIWRFDAWEKVRSSFPDDNEGSRVIFTTRESEVATKAQTKFSPHFKRFLSDKESWELLQLMAFPEAPCPPNLAFPEAPCPPNPSDSGKLIARNCRGLPLALTVIGRLLARRERSQAMWNEISEKTSSFASEEGCMHVLELSYKHLPEHLKSCFLYLGIFVEDEKFPAKRLTNLWIAEGFVQRSHRDSVEIVANEYLRELVDRSLLHVAKRSSDNRIKACQVHDIIRDFCKAKAQEENIFQSIHGIEDCNSSYSNSYRLGIHMYWDSFVDGEVGDPGVKSLLYFDTNVYCYEYDGSEPIFSKFPLVQVLDLENFIVLWQEEEVYRLIETMTSLVHLRYLALPIEDSEVAIPSRLADLKNLETFILRRSNTAPDHVWWNETFWRMETLRYVDVGRCHLIPCPAEFEAYPPLYNLECFSTLVLKPATAKKLLKRLPNVRKLSCFIDSDSVSYWVLALDLLSKLESLKLRFENGVNVILPRTLKKLSLYVHPLPSQLGKLPLLEVLKIYGYREKRWDVEDEKFPKLKFLKLQSYDLSEWNAADRSFPCLEQLVLVNCQKLHEIPASFQESATLKRIEIHNSSPDLSCSAREIRDELKDLGNEIELIVTDGW